MCTVNGCVQMINYEPMSPDWECMSSVIIRIVYEFLCVIVSSMFGIVQHHAASSTS